MSAVRTPLLHARLRPLQLFLDFGWSAVGIALFDLAVNLHYVFTVCLDVLHRRGDLFFGERQPAADLVRAAAVFQVVEDSPD
jgi:hypothetical protein